MTSRRRVSSRRRGFFGLDGLRFVHCDTEGDITVVPRHDPGRSRGPVQAVLRDAPGYR